MSNHEGEDTHKGEDAAILRATVKRLQDEHPLPQTDFGSRLDVPLLVAEASVAVLDATTRPIRRVAEKAATAVVPEPVRRTAGDIVSFVIPRRPEVRSLVTPVTRRGI